MAILDPGVNARFVGISGTATANTTTDIDYEFTDNRLLHGMGLILKNHVDGDKLTIQVVDKNNLLGFGANTVLSQYVTDFQIVEDSQHQGNFYVPEKIVGDVPVGMFLRFKYTSVGTTNNVTLRVNIFLYEPAP